MTHPVPMRRAGCTEEIADAIVYPASDKATFIAGRALGTDGRTRA